MSLRLFAATTVLAFLPVSLADDPTQKYEAGGVSFEAPEGLGIEQAAEPHAAPFQFKLDPQGKDEDPAELVITALRGGGGSVDANVARWKTQFEGKDGGAPELTSEKRKGKNVEVTFVEASGRYVAAVTPGSPKKFDKTGWRLLGVIVPGDGVGYYFKLVGPDATVKAAKPAFEAMIKTIAIDKG